MAKIIVNRENFQVDEIDLEQGTLNIGRTTDNDLVIDDLTVSGRHAKIVTVFNSTYVEDLGSTNGTYVNGKKVQTHTLHNGDVVTIGHYQILFRGEEAPSEGVDDTTRMINTSQVEMLRKQAKRSGRSASPSAAQAKQSAPAKGPTLVHDAPRAAVQASAAEPAVAQRAQARAEPAAKEEAAVAPMEAEPLPDIEDPTIQLDGHGHGATKMKPLRRSDTSPSAALKTIVLAALTAAATFLLMLLLFDL